MFKLSHALKAFVCIVLAIQLAGCGTIMYPQRRGQQGGKIDAGVAVLDGVGLLLFIIPGVIAFAVDFSDGAIYLPGTSRSSLDMKNLKVVKFGTGHSSAKNLENIIKEETGYNVKFSQGNMKVIRLSSKDDVRVSLAEALGVDKN